jgi:hypothetical protein
VPLLAKERIWRDAACDISGPGLKLKSKDPAVPAIEEVLTVRSYTFADADPTEAARSNRIDGTRCGYIETP